MKRIEILMSAYNGDKFIGEQIESIMRQRGVDDLHLTIRDDGSSDETVSVIKKITAKYPNAISVHVGENIGYRKSFLRLLIWLWMQTITDLRIRMISGRKQKIFRAVECLEKEKSGIKLYVGSLKIVDSDMKEIADKDIFAYPKYAGKSFYEKSICRMYIRFFKSL